MRGRKSTLRGKSEREKVCSPDGFEGTLTKDREKDEHDTHSDDASEDCLYSFYMWLTNNSVNRVREQLKSLDVNLPRTKLVTMTNTPPRIRGATSSEASEAEVELQGYSPPTP